MADMKKFVSESLNEWLNEQEERDAPTYGCVMLYTNMRDWEDIHTSGIDPEDVYIKPHDQSYGIETEPHITVLYGIHEDEAEPEIVENVMKENMEDVTVTISKISIFENEEYDVVKYDVPPTEQLLEYRKIFEDNFENTQSFPDYHPHMTLAYVKPGEGKKYESELDEPFEVTFTKGVYSWHEKNEDGEVELKKKNYVFNTDDEEYEL